MVIGDLEQADPAAAARRISADGGVTGIVVDATSEDSLRNLVESAVETYGRLDVMCHVSGSSPKEDLDLEHDDQVMHLDVRSAVVGSRLALPRMIEGGGGSVITTASVGGLSGDCLQVACATAEAAVIRLTQYIATQYGAQNVRCGSVAPGAITSPALEDALGGGDRVDPLPHLPAVRRGPGRHRLGEALTSDESRCITGQCLVVDGGMTGHSTIAEDRRSLLPDDPTG